MLANSPASYISSTGWGNIIGRKVINMFKLSDQISKKSLLPLKPKNAPSDFGNECNQIMPFKLAELTPLSYVKYCYLSAQVT